MATLTSQLIVSLIDRVTAPARGIAATVDQLQDAQRRNNAQMDEMRGRMVDAAAMAYALARAVGAPVRVAADFETSMNRVTALSGATGEQFDQLRQQALELGRSTQFTASQAGDAMGFLAMAGFEATQILGAMPGTLQLASAAQMDLAQTADVVSNILTGYGKDVSELAHVNDVLVKAFTSANTDLSQLAEAMKYAGPIASAAGVRFEETAAAISLMGNAGIQGSMAGTSLRGALTRILNPTSGVASAMQEAGLSFTDARGRLLPFADIIEQLEPHAEDAGLMMQLFGQRAGPAMAALVGQGAAAMRELEGELINSAGTAERVSNVQMAGFNGMMREFWSVVEGVQIAIGTGLLPALTEMGRAMIAILGPIASFAEANPRLTATIVGVTAALVALRVASIASHFAFLWMKGSVIAASIQSLRALQVAMRLAAIPFLPFIAGLRAARTALIGYTAAAAIAGHGGALAAMGSSMLGLLNPLRLVRAALVAMRVALISTGIGAIVVGIAMAGAWIYNNWSGIGQMFAGIADGIRESFPAAGAIIDGISASVSTLVGWFTDLTGPIDANGETWRGWGQAVGEAIGGALQNLTALPGQLVGLIGDGLSAGWSAVTSWLGGLSIDTEGLGERIGAGMANLGSLALAQVQAALGAGWDAVTGFISGLVWPEPGSPDWSEIGSRAIAGLMSGLRAANDNLVSFVRGIMRGLFDIDVDRVAASGAEMVAAFLAAVQTEFEKVLAWFRDLPGRIVEAIGSIDLTGIISWPSLPSWLGGGEAAAANDNMPATAKAANDNPMLATAAAERALETARELARLQAAAADQSWWQVDFGSTNREIAALSAEFEALTSDLPASAQAGMTAYVAALNAGGGQAGAEAAAIADDILTTLNVTATPRIDTSGFDTALARVRALDGAIRRLPNASIGGTAAVAGARAAGGPIVRGRAYLVGEEGPEIITAGSDGYVHTADESRDMMRRGGVAAGGGRYGDRSNVSVVIHMGGVHGVTDPERVADVVERRLNQKLRDEISGLQADGEWNAA